MLRLNSITFRDDETDKIIEVHLTNRQIATSVTSNQPFSADEFAICVLNAGMLVSGGTKEVRRFAEKKKE